MSDAVARDSIAAQGHLNNQAGAAIGGLDAPIASHLYAGFDSPDEREPLASRLARYTLVAGFHAGAIALVLTIQPRFLADLLPTALNVRTIVEDVKPPEPPKPEVIPPKPLPQAKQMVRPPQPAAPVMTAANADSPAASFSVAPQPPPPPPAPPAPTAPAAPAAPPAPLPVTAARFDADYLKNPPPAYPSISRRMREEGRVLLLVRVSPQGLAESVQLRQSSGYPRLDEAALDAVRQWRFIPAKRGEEPVAASVVVPLVFRIE